MGQWSVECTYPGAKSVWPKKRNRPARTPFVESTNTLSPTRSGPGLGGVSSVVVVVVTVSQDLSGDSHIRSRKETRLTGESILDEADEYDRLVDASRPDVEGVTRDLSLDLDLERRMPQVGRCCFTGDGDRETGDRVLGDAEALERYSFGTRGYRVRRQSRENIPLFGGQQK